MSKTEERSSMIVAGEVQAQTEWVRGSSWSDMLAQLHSSLFDQAEGMGADALLLRGAHVEEGRDRVSMSVSGIALRNISPEVFVETEREAPGSLVPLPRA